MSTSSPSVTEVDAAVWRAVAGASFQIPSLNSYVYYFPQGHMEQHSSASVENQNVELKRPFIPCQVLSVRLLSNPSSDQVFVKLLLQPLHPWEKRLNCSTIVPRFCADSIFPPLDFGSDPPVQNLIMKDTHNNAWEFRHIYRGTPRRHLLTTGWSKFVNAKRLIAGDSVVFMRKKSTNELFTGIRRAGPFGSSCWDGGKTSADSSMSVVMEAIKNSDQGIAFEVVHYPRFGWPDFVVSAEKVEDALRICWSAGMRVKMAVETEDSSRMTWFQGTVAATVLPGSGPWCGSPWRMLQVHHEIIS
ncbi:UNVERIFIED_CONTAM: Auxin response factor 17 [Sesamum angustifolium]|uniref:Auxin response factor n=1 Tax=Sesamum angustifolium TaxID=2727405 RepID=A0AAW2L5U8_9LAMI